MYHPYWQIPDPVALFCFDEGAKSLNNKYDGGKNNDNTKTALTVGFGSSMSLMGVLGDFAAVEFMYMAMLWRETL